MEPTNTTAPTTATPAAKTAPETKKLMLQLGDPAQFEIFSRKVRGSKTEEMESVCLPVVDTNSPAIVQNFLKFWGVPNTVALFVREIIRPACLEASNAGFDDNDNFNQVRFLEDLKGYADPRQQKARGPNKAAIMEQQIAFSEELTKLTEKAIAGTWTEADKNRFMVIKVENAKLAEALAKKNRRGKKPAAAAPAPAPAK